MKKLTLLLLSFLVAFSPMALVQAQDADTDIVQHVRGKGFFFGTLDDGSADIGDIHAASAVAGKVIKTDENNEETEFSRGLLKVRHIGSEKFVMKEIAVEDGQFSADLYEKETKVGNILLERETRSRSVNGEEVTFTVWIGDAEINDVSYKAVFRAEHREGGKGYKAGEVAHIAVKHCKEQPDDCKEIRGEVKDYCQQNAEDEKCKRLVVKFMKDHPDRADERFAQFVRKHAETACVDEESDGCKEFVEDAKAHNDVFEKLKNKHQELVIKKELVLKDVNKDRLQSLVGRIDQQTLDRLKANAEDFRKLEVHAKEKLKEREGKLMERREFKVKGELEDRAMKHRESAKTAMKAREEAMKLRMDKKKAANVFDG